MRRAALCVAILPLGSVVAWAHAVAPAGARPRGAVRRRRTIVRSDWEGSSAAADSEEGGSEGGSWEEPSEWACVDDSPLVVPWDESDDSEEDARPRRKPAEWDEDSTEEDALTSEEAPGPVVTEAVDTVAQARATDATIADFLVSSIRDLPLPDPRLGTVSSHVLVDMDEDGDPVIDRERMVFVDEASCIGCTSCATIATQTFLMEDDYGRARAFSQSGDTDEMIEEAIATCPVDCIHYVPFDELVKLEKQRDMVMEAGYNFKGRLVGNEGLLSTNQAGAALLDISSNTRSRCSNCPSNKCAACPMYSVGDDAAKEESAILNKVGRGGAKGRKRCGNCPQNGCPACPLIAQNPEFRKQRVRRERKRAQRITNDKDQIRKQSDLGGAQGVDL